MLFEHMGGYLKRYDILKLWALRRKMKSEF